jgi:hypothetical protein
MKGLVLLWEVKESLLNFEERFLEDRRNRQMQ